MSSCVDREVRWTGQCQRIGGGREGKGRRIQRRGRTGAERVGNRRHSNHWRVAHTSMMTMLRSTTHPSIVASPTAGTRCTGDTGLHRISKAVYQPPGSIFLASVAPKRDMFDVHPNRLFFRTALNDILMFKCRPFRTKHFRIFLCCGVRELRQDGGFVSTIISTCRNRM